MMLGFMATGNGRNEIYYRGAGGASSLCILVIVVLMITPGAVAINVIRTILGVHVIVVITKLRR